MTDAVQTDALPEDGMGRRFYFIAWRWHFYAGLYVAPFLVMLAATGLLMLWIAVLSDLNGEKGMVVPAGAPMAVSALQAAAEAAVPGGTAKQYIEPLGADRVAVFKVQTDAAATTIVIDPYTGAVRETFPWQEGWYQFANEIHGTLMIGDLGDRLIEIAASLGIVPVVTGVYLHWPRGQRVGAAFVPLLAARGRAFWKSLHGTVCMWMSLDGAVPCLGPQLGRDLGGQDGAGLVHFSRPELGRCAAFGQDPRQHEPQRCQGRAPGVWNIALNTAFCLSMIFLPLSGLVMWWKRRPARSLRLAAPPRPQGVPFWKRAAVVVVALGVMFPMAGAVMLAAVVLDPVLMRLMPRRAV